MRRASSGKPGLWWLLLLLALLAPPHMRAQGSNAPRLLRPSALVYDAAGDLFIADSNLHQVFEATVAGSWKVIAGTGTQGFGGDGGLATLAQLNAPAGLAITADGTLYIADAGNHRIRAVKSDAMIRTIAGDGHARFAGDNAPASAASLARPSALALDPTGRLLLCDTDNQRLRRIDLATGIITTIAGSGVQGFAGDGGLATAAVLDSPAGVAVAADGRIFLADTHNARVRVIDGQGTITTIAGSGQRGYSGDGGPAYKAALFLPRGLALDATGALLIADTGNQRVRRVDVAGQIATIAGSGIEGGASAGTAATAATMRSPVAVTVSPFGWPAVADSLNAQPRVLVSSAQLYVPAALAPSRTDTVTLTSAIYGAGSVQVQVAGEGGEAAGSISVQQGGSSAASGSVTNGQASVSLPQLSAGTYPVHVSYTGDGIHPALDEARDLTILQAPLTAVADPASTVYGQTLPLLTGTLRGVLAQDAGQVTATYTTAAPASLAPAGLYPIQASLSGPAAVNYTLGSQTAGELTIQPAPSRTTLSATAQGGYAGLPITLQATVATSTQGQPTGSVTFLDAGSPVATASLVGGVASTIFRTQTAGTHTLVAQYAGDQNFKPSVSAVAFESVGDLPDFSLTATGKADQTVTGGGTVAYTFDVAGNPGPFTGAVLFSVVGLPKGASAVFSPIAVVPGSGTASVTLTVTTVPLVASAQRGAVVLSATAFLAVLLVSVGPRRRRGLLLSGTLLAFGSALPGCGARSVNDALPGSSPQSATLVVTGTGTNLLGSVVTHSASVMLHVQ